MVGRLQDKVALVTGAASVPGLGSATARRFAEEGAIVWLTDRDGAGAEAVAASIRETGGRARSAAHDVTREADWDRVMAVNLRGPWLCARACANALRERGGAIVNVASATVLSGSPLWAHYVASKGGVIGLTRVLARELGDHDVRVNALAPGFTLTDASLELIEDAESYGVARGAIKRALQPDDIVGTAVFLASDAAAMITGQTFVVDGGRQFL